MPAEISRFQSLGRDSGGWDVERLLRPGTDDPFQSLGRDSGGWDNGRPEEFIMVAIRFNPSVGIQVVGTGGAGCNQGAAYSFQSLGRDSGGWDVAEGDEFYDLLAFQSLGRDSGGWDAIGAAIAGAGIIGFNPSVGIQVVGTARRQVDIPVLDQFQSLGRDSGGWDRLPGEPGSNPPYGFNPSVGIQVVGTVNAIRSGTPATLVSIPRSGFRWLGLWRRPLARSVSASFQSLGRDSGGWDPAS